MTTLPEINQEEIRKEYENMTYNEMSKRLAESFKELSEMLGNNTISKSTSTVSTSTNEDSEDDEEEEEEIEEEEEGEQSKLSKLFLKSVSTGNIEKVSEYIKNPLIDIDVKDEEGTSALIYAACFGKFEIAETLILGGANIDSQDSHGWTALMWATTNHHEKIVKLLIDHGASSQTKSAKGRTVMDFVQKDQKIADIISTSIRDSISSTSSIMGYSADDADYEENYESFLSIDNEFKPKLIEEFLMNFNEDDYDYDYDDNDEENGDDDEDENDLNKEMEFNWDRCMPDQMFVFAADDLPYILDTVITNLTLPVRNVQEIFMPANVVFLSARFAHYFSSSELAEDVMEGALMRISSVIKSNTHNVHILSYWITNMTRLLYYLKKDAELVVATAEYQLRLSELISETYNFIVNDIGKRITQILQPAMLEFDPISGMEEVNYVDDWQRFFRRSSSIRRSEDMQRAKSEDMQRTNSNMSHEPSNSVSPKTITQLFSSTYYVFQSYEVHSTIIIQALAQFFHFLSCELFNRMLTNKKYLSRSKAVQVRMNLSVLEEWIHQNHLPPNLTCYLKPSIQLTQFLQCLSQLDTVESFESTIKMFDAINPIQIRRCVLNYRYETQEPRISEEIERLVNQSVEDIRQSVRKSVPVSQQLRRSLSGCSTESMNQIMGSIFNQNNTRSVNKVQEEQVDEGNVEIHETKDSRFMLPFFVPTTAQLSHSSSSLIPIIPEDWMNQLDKSC